jgi:hypothetical protein
MNTNEDRVGVNRPVREVVRLPSPVNAPVNATIDPIEDHSSAYNNVPIDAPMKATALDFLRELETAAAGGRDGAAFAGAR